MKELKHITVTLSDFDDNNKMLSCFSAASQEAINIDKLETLFIETAKMLGLDMRVWSKLEDNNK
jgi:hypothetical protein